MDITYSIQILNCMIIGSIFLPYSAMEVAGEYQKSGDLTKAVSAGGNSLATR